MTRSTSMKKRTHSFVLSAGYGMGNLGDEAICETIVKDLSLVSPNCSITILVFNYTKFCALHQDLNLNGSIKVREFFFIQKQDYFSLRKYMQFLVVLYELVTCNAFVWGGGGMVKDSVGLLRQYLRPLLIAQFFRKPVFVYPVGVNKVHLLEVRKKMCKVSPHTVLNVRDEQSRQNLNEIFGDRSYLYTIDVVSDPVFHFGKIQDRVRERAGGPVKIGLNLAYWKARHAITLEFTSFIDRVVQTLNGVYKDTEFELVWLPTDVQKDQACLDLMSKKLTRAIVVKSPKILSAHDLIDAFTKVDFLIASRMHSLILSSHVKDLPVVSIIYDEKVEHLKNDLGHGKFFSIANFPSEQTLLYYLSNPQECVVDWNSKRSDSKKIIDSLRLFLSDNVGSTKM